MIKRILTSLAVLLIVGILGSLFWLDQQFEEPQAEYVTSLAGELEAKSVLAVFAHPDDEQLITGLLIRAKERDGVITRMITVTKGEAGTQMPVIARQEELGVIRHAEVLKSGFALGVKEQEVWEYPDSGVTGVDFEELVNRITEYILLWQPDMVVTFWPESGFSNHPDHMQVGLATQQAVYRLQRENSYSAPKTIAYVLAPSRMMARLGGERGQNVAANQPVPTHAMPGEASAKIRGWNIHASQGQFVQRVYGMPPWFLHRVNDKEFYFVEMLD